MPLHMRILVTVGAGNQRRIGRRFCRVGDGIRQVRTVPQVVQSAGMPDSGMGCKQAELGGHTQSRPGPICP